MVERGPNNSMLMKQGPGKKEGGRLKLSRSRKEKENEKTAQTTKVVQRSQHHDDQECGTIHFRGEK